MNSAETQLRELLAVLQAAGMPVARRFYPGLAPTRIAELEATFGFRFPDDIVSVYSLADGVSLDGATDGLDTDIYMGYRMLPLGESVDIVVHEDAPDGLERGLLPFFDLDGNRYLVDCREGPGFGTVIHASQDGDPFIEYNSVSSMLETITAWYLAGIYGPGLDQVIRDRKQWAMIGKAHNPGVDRWDLALRILEGR